MDRIWAPWRLEFVKAASGHDPLECVFCAAPTDTDDQKQLILHRGPTCFVILNLYPYTNGHILIAPYRHLATPGEMDTVERAELWDLLDQSLSVLDRTEPTPGSTSAEPPEPASKDTATCTSFHAGMGTQTLCQCWPTPASWHSISTIPGDSCGMHGYPLRHDARSRNLQGL